jgi:hydrogenase maturation protease
MSNGRAAVIGLGNPLMGDDGFGLAVLEHLRETWLMPDDVELVDGGTWGMTLLPVIEDAECVILIDAIDMGWSPGTPVELERDEIPMLFSHKLSPHQVDMRETLAAAELRGKLPLRVAAIGVQPAVVALGTDLSSCCASKVAMVAELVAVRLHRWGYSCEPGCYAVCAD